MPTPIKSPREVDRIARAGEVVDAVLAQLALAVHAGLTTRDLDALARDLIARTPAHPVLLGYVPRAAKPGVTPPFPGCCCVSVGDDVVHGAPLGRLIRAGEPVTVDLALQLDGWCADAAVTVIAGDAPGEGTTAESSAGAHPDSRAHHRAEALVRGARAVLERTLAHLRPGVRWSDAAQAGEAALAGTRLRLVHAYAGHGIGKTLHEPPRVPFASPDWARAGEDFPIAEGLVLCIEPIVVEVPVVAPPAAATPAPIPGGPSVPPSPPALMLRDDAWTVATADGSWAAHEEVTVVVTREGPRVLAGNLPRVRPVSAR